MNKKERLSHLLELSTRSKDEDKELYNLKREVLKGVKQTRNVRITQKLQADNSNTLDFTFISRENAGTRYDWGRDKYYTEQLDVNGAITDNLNTFFKNHYHDVDSAIGKITNIRVDNGELVGNVIFGSNADSQALLIKYKEGILTDVSIGYEIKDYSVEDRSATNEQDIVTVTNFDIFEVSAVGLGFDSGAKKRSINLNNKDYTMDKELLGRLAKLEAMATRSKEEAEELKKLRALKLKEDADELQKLKDEKNEAKRVAEITKIAMDFGDRGKKILDGNPNATADEFRAKILADFAGESQTHQTSTTNDGAKERGKFIDAIVDALAIRSGVTIDKPAEGADKYRYASLTTIANMLLPEEQRSLNAVEVAERSLKTGDFPLLLQSVGARVLTNEFEKATNTTYQIWVKQVDVPDFRTMQELTNSLGGGRLSKTLENGDLKELGGAEAEETWRIEPFGNKFVLTRQMLINDDLGAFTNVISTFARMAKTTANGIVYDLLQGKGDYANYKMADGSGLFVSARNNSASDALSGDALSSGRLAMRKHKSIDGKTPLNITPKYLIVPPELEVVAKEILNSTSKLGADNVNVPNVNQGAYQLIIEPEIESPTAWYLASDHRTLKLGFLAGTGRKPVIKKNDSSVLRAVFEGVFDVGVMAESYKGLYRGNV